MARGLGHPSPDRHAAQRSAESPLRDASLTVASVPEHRFEMADNAVLHTLQLVGCRFGLHRWGATSTRPDGRVERRCAECDTHVVGRGFRRRPDTETGTRHLRSNAQGDSARY